MFLCSQPLLIMQGLQICGLRGQAGDAHKGPWRPQLPLVADRTQQLPARGKQAQGPARPGLTRRRWTSGFSLEIGRKALADETERVGCPH